MIVQNQVKCLKCNSIIVSTHVHDYVQCPCGNIAVDGGSEYLRRAGTMYDEQGIPTCEDQSFSVPNYIIDACQKSLTKAEKANKNSLGKVLAIIRTLKAHDILVTES